jgi:hypothetical protein
MANFLHGTTYPGLYSIIFPLITLPKDQLGFAREDIRIMTDDRYGTPYFPNKGNIVSPSESREMFLLFLHDI